MEPHVQRRKHFKYSLFQAQGAVLLGKMYGLVEEDAGRKARELGCGQITKGIVFDDKDFRLDPADTRVTQSDFSNEDAQLFLYKFKTLIFLGNES